MATDVEEQQAKEFLKRAEIRTMKKDLRALREVDALKERDKIAKIKTLEEQLDEKKKIDEAKLASEMEKIKREEVLTKNEGQQKIAEKDLKNYATEQERQQIFLFESERLATEKQIDEIDHKKDPELKLQKNNLLLQKRDLEKKLNAILEEEKKSEGEQNFVSEKSQTTTIPAEKKSLEQRRAEIEKQVQEIEKRRWGVEKQIEEIDKKATEIDKSSEMLVAEKNNLHDKVLGIDKSLREIYSVVMQREEEKRRGMAKEQLANKEALAKIRAEEKEKTQREQWLNVPVKKSQVKENFMKGVEAEKEQRKKFLQEVEVMSQTGAKNVEKSQSSTEESVVQKATKMPPPPPLKK